MKPINTNQCGFFHNENADPKQYIYGASPIVTEPLQVDRNWQPWCPQPELQNSHGFDPLSCASYNTLNPVEILIRRKYGFTDGYSDRFLAYATDTQKKLGNDPHYVAEWLRKNGVVDEDTWPFLNSIRTFEAYYAPVPSRFFDEAKKFPINWTFKHDTVRGLDDMWDALQYSPLGCSVGWNTIDENGYWFKNGNGPDFHWTTIVGGEYGKYFLAFDSAEPVYKKIRWADFKPQLVKRYSIEVAPQTISWLQEQINKIKAFLDSWKPMTQPSVPTNNLVNAMCLAIQRHEGWILNPPSRSVRNNNPGNLVFIGQKGATKEVNGRFAVFNTYEDGFNALKNMILNAARGVSKIYFPSDNLYDFFKKYAPSSDNNDPIRYAEVVANAMNVNPATFRLRDLI